MKTSNFKFSKFNYKKVIIDIIIYISIIIFDAFCFNIFLKLNLGTNPFGIFVSNLSLLTSISFGIIAFFVSLFQILMASYLRRTRIKFELLLYSFLFSVSVDILTPYINDLILPQDLGLKILILSLTIMALDLVRTLFKTTPFPRLGLFELLYGFKERFKLDLKWGSRLNNFLLFSLGVLISFVNGNFLSGIGIGTIVILVLNGVVLEKMSPKMHELYFELTKTKMNKQTQYKNKVN